MGAGCTVPVMSTDGLMQATPTPARKWPARRRWWLIGGLAAVAAVLAGLIVWLAWPESKPSSALAKQDPAGYRACTTLGSWMRGEQIDKSTGKPYAKAMMSVALSDTVVQAKTPAILATVSGEALDPATVALLGGAGAGLRFTNLQALYLACGEAGAAMPPYREY